NGKEENVLTEAIYLLTFHLLKDEIHPNYVDHALSLLTYVREFDELTEISVNLPSLIVTALRRQNRLGEAYTFGKMALEFLEKTVGESHAATLSLQHNLATVLDARGQYAKVMKTMQELNKKDLKYSTTGEITKSLILHAKTLCELSKYEEALPLYQIILGERTLDSKIALDSEISTAWHDYALLLSDMGRHSEAMDILQDVLSQRKKVLSPDDQYGLSTKRSMASVLQAQGKYVQAMKQLQEVFHESTKVYGEYYPGTLQAERDIGTLLLHKGDHKKALKKLEKVEKKFQKIFAESHPDALCTRANIVGALIHLKEYDRALQIAEDVYEAYQKIFGEKHKEALQAKFNIGNIFLKQGKLEEAEHMLQDVYRGYHDIFGPEHHKTVEMKDTLDILAVRKKYFPERRILHAAAQKGDLNKIVSLIQNGENVNEADSEGRRPLHYAASNGHLKVAKYLLMMGAMYNAVDFRKATPYQLASDEHMKDLLILIHELFKGVKSGTLINIAGHTELINTKDKNGYSLLHWAVYHSHKSIVQQLLDAGADTKCISLKGNTPLHVASSKGKKEIAEILLQSVTGNELSDLVNFKTTGGGNTALHVAAENNDRDMLKCLLMHGAIYDIQNKDGR
ncbi:Ankyrin repeat, PH and SEC7 domain containing protein secG, partial [Araneus ventricosus]